MKLLGIPKKNIFGNSSIFKLFNYQGRASGDEKVNLKSSALLLSTMTLKPNTERCKTESSVKEDKNSEKTNSGFLLFKGDENRLLRHSFQYALIYYRNLRMKIRLKDLKTLYTYIIISKLYVNFNSYYFEFHMHLYLSLY